MFPITWHNENAGTQTTETNELIQERIVQMHQSARGSSRIVGNTGTGQKQASGK